MSPPRYIGLQGDQIMEGGPYVSVGQAETFLREVESKGRASTVLMSAMMLSGMFSMPEGPSVDDRATGPDGVQRYYLRFENGHEAVMLFLVEGEIGQETLQHHCFAGPTAVANSHGAIESTAWKMDRSREGTVHTRRMELLQHEIEGRARVHGPLLECVIGGEPTRAELLKEIEQLKNTVCAFNEDAQTQRGKE